VVPPSLPAAAPSSPTPSSARGRCTSWAPSCFPRVSSRPSMLGGAHSFGLVSPLATVVSTKPPVIWFAGTDLGRAWGQGSRTTEPGPPLQVCRQAATHPNHQLQRWFQHFYDTAVGRDLGDPHHLDTPTWEVIRQMLQMLRVGTRVHLGNVLTQKVHSTPITQQAEQSWLHTRREQMTCQSIFPEN
jgi:hypothetical protein